MAVPTTLVIDATQQTLEITTSRDAVSIQGRSIETGVPTDGEVLTYSTSASEWVYLSVDENVDDRVAALIQDSAGGGLTWTYDDSAGTLTPAYVGDSTLVTTGTITSGTWQGTTVAVNQGGTGLASYAAGDVIYASGTTTLAKLAKGSDTEVLTLASGVPTWAAPTVGDITAVTAGAGMTGGGSSGDVTLNVIGTADKITVSADALTIASTYVGQTSITTLGTIAAGTWNGSAITGAYIDPTSSPLASTKLWIGSASNVAAEFALSGNATMTAGGVVTVSTAAACTGNAATATALQTARTIGGTSFDGTANIAVGLSATATALATARAINGTDFDGTAAITVTSAAGTLTGATLASGVTASSLTSLGTLASLGVGNVTSSGDISLVDNKSLKLGTGGDATMLYNGTHVVLDPEAVGSGAFIVSSRAGSLPSLDSTTTLIVQRNSATGNDCRLDILAGNDGASVLNFSDADSESAGWIQYRHTDNSMKFGVGSEKMRLTSTGLGINVTSISYRLDVSGTVRLVGLPTDDPNVAGALWDSSGDLKISQG